jgi:hypothetical protein
MRTLAAVLFLATLAFGQKAPETDSKEDWQRMKDCAAQAEKIGPGEAEANKGTYTNHYSRKYGRCFLKISWTTEKDGGVLTRGYRLIDAFEHTNIAVYQASLPESESKTVCYIDSPSGLVIDIVACSVARDFIVEHMRN